MNSSPRTLFVLLLAVLLPALGLVAPGYDPAPKGGRFVYDDSGTAPVGYEAVCKRPLLPVFCVADYGAVPDDGKDDTAAFRSALSDAQSAGGGIVYCPKGVYEVCPQPADKVTNEQSILPVTANNIVFQGEGAYDPVTGNGTKVRGWCLGMGDPKTNWRVTGDSYWKISRFSLFSFKGGSATGPRSVFQVRSMTLDGQLPYTGNSAVGGDVTTGDGWDLSHKAVLTAGAVDKILLLNTETVNWRAEHWYCGGGSGSFTAANSRAHGSNASAVSVTAKFTAVNCTVGGPNPGDDVYNGLENFATTASLGTNLTNCVVRPGSASPHGNGIALIGVPGSTTNVRGCQFVNCGKAVLASEVLSNFTFSNNTITNCGGGIITSILRLYPQFPIGFDHWLLDGNTSDKGGVFVNVQSHGPGPIDPLVISNNTITTSGSLLSGNFGNTLGNVFAVTNNTLGAGTGDTKNQVYNGVRGVWSGTARPTPGAGSNSANDYDASSTQTVVVPTSDVFTLNDVKNSAVPHSAVINPTTLGLYPVNYSVTFYQGPARRNWVIKADPLWNSLVADLPVAAGGVTLVYNGKVFDPR